MHVPDVPCPPGDEWSIRAAADAIRSTVAELRTARTAALHVNAICDGAHWRGEAFEVFRASVERKPLPEAVDHAIARMDHAAGALDTFAARFAENRRTIGWCRSRLWSLGLDGGEVPDELVAEVQRILHDADRAWEDHRAALRAVADTFDWLDDQPTFAQPPPSTFERVTGFAGDVVGFAGGIVVGLGQGLWELGELAIQLGFLLNPVTAPLMVQKIWDARDQIGAVLAYARENPGDFALLMGKAMIDADAWTEQGVAVWIGRRIPELLIALASGGLGAAGSSAAATVRGVRAGRAARSALDAAGVADHFADADRALDATEAAGRLGRGGFANRLSRLGADADAFAKVGDSGAFTRTDSGFGRLAHQLDAHPGIEFGRQVPGVINDEIKGFTQLPSRFLERQLGENLFTENVLPLVQRRFDSFVTGGWTSRLGIADGLLVGLPALSPQTQAAMIGVVGLDVVRQVNGPVRMMQDLHTGATAGAA